VYVVGFLVAKVLEKELEGFAERFPELQDARQEGMKYVLFRPKRVEKPSSGARLTSTVKKCHGAAQRVPRVEKRRGSAYIERSESVFFVGWGGRVCESKEA